MPEDSDCTGNSHEIMGPNAMAYQESKRAALVEMVTHGPAARKGILRALVPDFLGDLAAH